MHSRRPSATSPQRLTGFVLGLSKGPPESWPESTSPTVRASAVIRSPSRQLSHSPQGSAAHRSYRCGEKWLDTRPIQRRVFVVPSTGSLRDIRLPCSTARIWARTRMPSGPSMRGVATCPAAMSCDLSILGPCDSGGQERPASQQALAPVKGRRRTRPRGGSGQWAFTGMRDARSRTRPEPVCFESHRSARLSDPDRGVAKGHARGAW